MVLTSGMYRSNSHHYDKIMRMGEFGKGEPGANMLYSWSMVVVVAFPCLQGFWEKVYQIISHLHFFFFFKVEISLHTPLPLF